MRKRCSANRRLMVPWWGAPALIPSRSLPSSKLVWRAEGERTADLSTTLRSGRDDRFCLGTLSIVSKLICHLDRGIMGLRPTQGNEKRLGPASTLYGTVTLSLSSRPERRDLRFRRPFVELFFRQSVA